MYLAGGFASGLKMPRYKNKRLVVRTLFGEDEYENDFAHCCKRKCLSGNKSQTDLPVKSSNVNVELKKKSNSNRNSWMGSDDP
jgi:hypothetical protein